MYRYVNLALLVLFPVAWFAPLLRAGLLPLFSLKEISVMSGLASLWSSDVFLAIIVAVFAVLAPIVKTLLLALYHFSGQGARWLGAIEVMGKLAMADIFLIAVYVTLAKGLSVGRVETGWGLYLFTFCVLASLWVAFETKCQLRDAG